MKKNYVLRAVTRGKSDIRKTHIDFVTFVTFLELVIVH